MWRTLQKTDQVYSQVIQIETELKDNIPFNGTVERICFGQKTMISRDESLPEDFISIALYNINNVLCIKVTTIRKYTIATQSISKISKRWIVQHATLSPDWLCCRCCLCSHLRELCSHVQQHCLQPSSLSKMVQICIYKSTLLDYLRGYKSYLQVYQSSNQADHELNIKKKRMLKRHNIEHKHIFSLHTKPWRIRPVIAGSKDGKFY